MNWPNNFPGAHALNGIEEEAPQRMPSSLEDNLHVDLGKNTGRALPENIAKRKGPSDYNRPLQPGKGLKADEFEKEVEEAEALYKSS
jgi:hypothetical protein